MEQLRLSADTSETLLDTTRISIVIVTIGMPSLNLYVYSLLPR